MITRLAFSLLMIVCWCTPIFAWTGEDVEVRISYYDGTVYVVTDFTFYSHHKEVEGLYFRSSKDRTTRLLVNSGKLWQTVWGKDVLSIQLKPDINSKLLKVHIELKSGRTIKGTVPINISETWEDGEYFWIQGITTKFGKSAKYKCKLADIAFVETIKEEPKYFKIKNKDGKEILSKTIEFGLYGTMPYPSAAMYYGVWPYKIILEGMEVEVSNNDIHSFTFDESGRVTLTMKGGESDIIRFVDVTRIYGELKTGEILFDDISSPIGAKIKSIEFLGSDKK